MQDIKLMAALLHYPSPELQAHAGELLAAAERAELGEGVKTLIRELGQGDLLELQSRYVETFDRGRACALHLFEHVHGESRDRGQALVDLLEVYRKAGFHIALSELPDYLPMFLEFVALSEPEQARQWLAEIGHILRLLRERLLNRESPYAALFEPLLARAGLEAEADGLAEQVRTEERDDTPEALDKAWAEEPITFGLGQGCPSATPPRVAPVQWKQRGETVST